MLPFFLWLTYRVGKVRREVSSETQKSLADMTRGDRGDAVSVSGILLTKTFGQQEAAIGGSGRSTAAGGAPDPPGMVGRWFFMIMGTIFSITPAFVYWLAG